MARKRRNLHAKNPVDPGRTNGIRSGRMVPGPAEAAYIATSTRVNHPRDEREIYLAAFSL